MTGSAALACPTCHTALACEIVGAIAPHRCAGCAGLWLDPPTFRALCEVEARGSPGALARREPAAPKARRPRREEPVRYLRCPACGDAMNRVNFARVSGVVVDVCRPHGAWLEAEELAAIRRFVRDGGAARYRRRQALDQDLARRPAGAPGSAPLPSGERGLLELLGLLGDLLSLPL